jgi:hypothetical protein
MSMHRTVVFFVNRCYDELGVCWQCTIACSLSCGSLELRKEALDVLWLCAHTASSCPQHSPRKSTMKPANCQHSLDATTNVLPLERSMRDGEVLYPVTGRVISPGFSQPGM